MKSLKVLHVIDSGGLYGAEIVLLNLVEEQIKQGLSPLILSAGVPGTDIKPLESEAKKRNLPVKIFRMKPGLNLKKAIEIATFASSEEFDLIHSHGFKFNFLLGILSKAILKTPIISTVHGYVIPPKYSKLRLYLWLDRFILPRLSGIVFVNEAMPKQGFFKHLKLKNSFVVDNGVDTSSRELVAVPPSCHFESRFNQFSDKAAPLVCAVGRLTKEKGFGDLIRAFVSVKNQYPNAKLVIFGEGYLEKELKEITDSQGLTDSVFFAGHTTDVLYYLSKADIFALSSHTEGLPIVLLEAMALTLPIVATKVGGIPQVLNNGQCGMLVEPEDITALSKSMIELFGNKQSSKELSEQAFKRVKESYSKIAMAKKYSTVYQDILKGASL